MHQCMQFEKLIEPEWSYKLQGYLRSCRIRGNMTDLGDILERALGGNTLNELLAQGLKTLLCCSRHNYEAMTDCKEVLI